MSVFILVAAVFSWAAVFSFASGLFFSISDFTEFFSRMGVGLDVLPFGSEASGSLKSFGGCFSSAEGGWRI